jgi:HSP20 family molecular chaperone IbpA
MARLSLFNSPLMLGFDQFEQAVERLGKAAVDGYPPYNIEQIGDNGLRITLAVAGFALEDLSVQLADNQLTIRGKQAEEDKSRVYLHRGIGARQFQRSFILADGLEVVGAELDNGLLHLDLRRPRAETLIRSIAINGPARGKKSRAKMINVEAGEQQP